MNKAELIKEYNRFLRESGLTTNDAVVGAGGSMLLFGLRDSTGDIDMSIPQDIFDFYRIVDKCPSFYFGTTLVVQWSELIDLHVADGKETVLKDGVRTWTLQEVLKFKKGLNRPKDQTDIVKLQQFLGE